MDSTYTTLIGSRGWHVYGKTIWKKQRKNEVVQVKQETNTIALEIDSCANSVLQVTKT